MQHDLRTYLFDINQSIDSIFEYLGKSRDFQVYKLRRGIERELEIIGEATNRILIINATIAISDARRIVDLRNWVIHGYDRIDDVIIWGIVTKDLPKLKIQIAKLLSEAEE